VGRLAAGHRLVFSYMSGIDPPVLHGRAGPGDRRAGRRSAGNPDGTANGARNRNTGTTGSTAPGGTGGPGAGMGGEGSTNSELSALLEASTTKWSAAVSGATSAAGLELASGTAVIALGGWNGSDPSPTLAQFQAYVAAGQISYYISGGGMGGGGGGGQDGTTTASSQIATWVAATYPATTVGGSTVYHLTTAS
jgi:hypothetical protein